VISVLQREKSRLLERVVSWIQSFGLAFGFEETKVLNKSQPNTPSQENYKQK
jgi:hypothetical protein